MALHNALFSAFVPFPLLPTSATGMRRDSVQHRRLGGLGAHLNEPFRVQLALPVHIHGTLFVILFPPCATSFVHLHPFGPPSVPGKS